MTKEQIRIEADKYNRSLSKHPMSVDELTDVLVGFYERLQPDYKANDCKHPRDQRSYIGGGMLRCKICGDEFR